MVKWQTCMGASCSLIDCLHHNIQQEVEKARVLLEVDFDVRKKELEEQMAAAAGAAASEATVKAPVGPSAGKGKLAVTGKTKGKGSSKA